jgi:hypothetical protein
MRHWRNVVLIAIVAAFCFGGSCECKTRSHGPVGAPRATGR